VPVKKGGDGKTNRRIDIPDEYTRMQRRDPDSEQPGTSIPQEKNVKKRFFKRLREHQAQARWPGPVTERKATAGNCVP